jgi:hypothetical protein
VAEDTWKAHANLPRSTHRQPVNATNSTIQIWTRSCNDLEDFSSRQDRSAQDQNVAVRWQIGDISVLERAKKASSSIFLSCLTNHFTNANSRPLELATLAQQLPGHRQPRAMAQHHIYKAMPVSVNCNDRPNSQVDKSSTTVLPHLALASTSEAMAWQECHKVKSAMTQLPGESGKQPMQEITICLWHLDGIHCPG